MPWSESTPMSQRREFVEETKIVVSKDDLVYVEHQRFINGFDRGNEVYWYGVLVPNLLLYSERENDIGERLDLFDVSPRGFSETRVGVALSPNMSYLIPKAQRFLDLHYLDRPHPG